MRQHFNKVESDFIQFISSMRGLPSAKLEKEYINIKDEFKLSGSNFRNLTLSIYRLLSIFYGQADENELIKSYKFHAPMHLLRFISYSFPRPKPSLVQLLQTAAARIRGTEDKSQNYKYQAELLVKLTNDKPVVVDYGCGLGYISYEIAKQCSEAKIYLVDIDCLTLDFAFFRFKRHGFNVEKIPITPTRVYPRLPKHNICIATEVMEHIAKPTNAYENIMKALVYGGVLLGNFDDHDNRMFHISPKLDTLRHSVARDFTTVARNVYRRDK